ncbi:MAG: CHAT domain-containing tetratricopeptide repeat protein [Acidobacteriota bacterium]
MKLQCNPLPFPRMSCRRAGDERRRWFPFAACLLFIALVMWARIASHGQSATTQAPAVQETRRLSDEALRLSRAGKHAEALAAAERVLALGQQAFGQEHPEVALALNLLATVHRNKGDLAQAEPLYLRAVAMAEKTMTPGQADLAAIYIEVGSLYLLKGDFIQAEARYQRARTIWEQALGANHPNVARVWTNLANLYGRKGDRLKSAEALKRALEIRERAQGAEHPDLVPALTNLGSLAFEAGDFDGAEPYYQRALKISDKGPGQETPPIAQLLNNLAAIYTERRDFARAEQLHRRALAARERLQGDDHPDVARSLTNLGSLYAVQGDYAQAEPMHQRALAIREKSLGPQHPLVAQVLGELVHDNAAQNKLQQAIAAGTRATTVSERNLALNLAVGSEREKLAYLSTFLRETNQTISLHARYAPSDANARRLALTTVLRRKGRALDSMTDSIAALRRRAAPLDQALLDRLKTTRAQLARLVLGGPQRTTPAEHQSQIKTLETKREELEDQISRRSAEFRAQSLPVTLAGVQAAIPARAALIEFVAYRPYNVRYTSSEDEFGQPRYLAYVVSRQGEPRWVDLGAKRPIDDAIDQLRRALRDRKRRDYRKQARAVDRLVMQPIRPLLATTRRVLIAPDGNINLIPFAALVDERNRFLVERYTFSYLTSGRDLLRLQVKQPSKQSALIVANPDFGPDPKEDAGKGAATERILRYKTGVQTADGKVTVITQAFFPALPGTAGEAQALQSLLPGARLLTKDQATEALIKQAHGPNILHVATHGYFLEGAPEASPGERRAADVATQPVENPLLRSGLALAGANQSRNNANAEEDGILTALEAADLDLWGTRLVVLSACQTGVGDVKDGDGVYGLRRALVLAGSESQVMSLWSVSDLATRNLMIEYYQRLQRGEGRTEALRQVQLGFLRRSARSGAAANYSHPYFWAGFIQSGEWANLDGRR